MPPDASVTSIAEPSTSSSELLEPPLTDDAPSPVQDAGALDAAPFIGDGRWWLVGFEDPIAIVLSGTPGEQGALSGITCLGGIVDDTTRCNSLAGSFDGRDLEFSVPAFPEQPYAARTRLSEDGQRMTGDFTNASGDGSTWSTTWLRIPDHEVRIGQYEGDQWPALPARSSFTLVEAQDGGDEFLMGRSYDLIVIERQLIAGGFGSFAHTEMVLPQNEDDPLIVGPVAPTSDHLPIQLVITIEDDTATEIIAMTASAHSYRFVLLQGDGG